MKLNKKKNSIILIILLLLALSLLTWVLYHITGVEAGENKELIYRGRGIANMGLADYGAAVECFETILIPFSNNLFLFYQTSPALQSLT